MTVLGFLLLLVIGAICGAVAELIVGFSPGGFLSSVAIGFVGAFVGGWLAGVLGLPSMFMVQIEGKSIEIFWTVLGSIVLLLVVGALRRSSYYRRRYI